MRHPEGGPRSRTQPGLEQLEVERSRAFTMPFPEAGALRRILDTLSESVATFDLDGRLTFVNRRGRELLGVSEADVTELILSDLYPEREAERLVDPILPRLFESGHWSGNATLKTRSGHEVGSRQTFVALDDGFALIADTVDDRMQVAKSAEARLLANRREHVAAMALGIAHDWNNVIGPIMAFAELALAKLSEPRTVRRSLERILETAQKARLLAERLRKLGRGDPERTVVDLVPIVRQVAGWLSVTRPDLSIAVEIDEGRRTSVRGDSLALLQVVTNLGLNAVESLPDRPGVVRFHLSATTNPPTVRLSVRDDGNGIDAPTLERLYEPFFTTKPEGSGLGLAVTRDIVTAHGGTIVVESPPSGGAVATVELPAI